jgi:hypothetical protein
MVEERHRDRAGNGEDEGRKLVHLLEIVWNVGTFCATL